MYRIAINIIALWILVPVLQIKAQSDIPLATEDKNWKHVISECLPSGEYEYSAFETFISGDTLIEGQRYKKMFRKADGLPQQYAGGFRADGTQVFYRPAWPSMEGMIYDFGANVGDTLRLTNHEFASDEFQLIVKDVQAISLAGGESRKQFLLETPDGLLQERWTEGIGSEFGLHLSGASYYFLSCGNTELLCFKQNSELLYLNKKFASCDLNQGTNSVVDIEEQNIMQLSPNPVTDFLNFKSDESADVLKIFDLHGRLILEKEYLSQSERINLSLLPDGIYIIAVSYRSGNLIITDKLIVD